MYVKIFIICLARFVLVDAWTQTPEIQECSKEQYFRVSNITITDATISQMTTARFTLMLTKPLGNKPKLKLTLKKKSGTKIACLFGYGSCTYKLCEGTTEQEQALTSMWRNRCPVPTFEETPVVQFPMLPVIQMVAGVAPTRITIQFKVTDGNQTVGCQSFKVDIRRGKRKLIKGLKGMRTGLEE
uniref:Putative salivary lipocalin n=1 Tax=Rhipicephalus pulchellus TaxID=72859 RepID=L7LQJ1_RHIPC